METQKIGNTYQPLTGPSLSVVGNKELIKEKLNILKKKKTNSFKGQKTD